MATRKLGKYKTTKKEEVMQSLLDGGTIEGNLVVDGQATITAVKSITFSGNHNYKTPTQNITATASILAADSGTTYFINPAASTTLTLPAPTRGLHYRFIATDTDSNDIIIKTSSDGSSGANIGFGLHTVGGALLNAGASAVDLVTMGASSTNHTIGDWVDCYCDGTNWWFQGAAQVASSITHA